MILRAGLLLAALLVIGTATGNTANEEGSDSGGKVDDGTDIPDISDSGLRDISDEIDIENAIISRVKSEDGVISDSWVKDGSDIRDGGDSGAKVKCRTLVEEEVIYECGIQDGKPPILIQAKKNQYVKFTCQSPNVTCDYFPHLNLASGGVLDSVSLTGCPSAVTRCALAAANATGAGVLWLARPADSLRRDHVTGLEGVHVLSFFEADEIREVPLATIRALPELGKVRITGAELRLRPRMFLPPLPLAFLLLADCRITALPDDSFDGLPLLNKLYIYKNPITLVGENALNGLSNLEVLSLEENGLEEIRRGLLAPLGRLKELKMDRNRLKVLQEGAIAHLPHLEKIWISENAAPLSIESGAFSDLPKLSELEMSRSRITAVAAGFIANSSVAVLDLSRNAIARLESRPFSGLERLQKLDLSRNQIEELPPDVFRHLKALQELHLEGNRIQVLPDDLLSGLTSLSGLFVDQNRLHSIAPRALAGAPLRLFSASHNGLRFSSPSPSAAYAEYNQSPLSGLTDLEELVLSHNNLSDIPQDWRNVMVKLKRLDLTHNAYEVLSDVECEFLSGNLTVDLRHNRISAVYPYVFLPQRGERPTRDKANVFLLEDNPFVCDCRLTALKYWQNGGRILSTPPPWFELGGAACAGPGPLRGRLVTEVAPRELQCPLDPSKCPEGCECIEKSYDQVYVLNCPSLPRRWPEDLFDPKTDIHLKLRRANFTALPPFVTSLDLSNTGLRDLNFHFDDTLESLDVTGNEIRALPERFIRRNLTLKLAENPLACECDYAANIDELKAAQSKWATVADYARVTCASGANVSDVFGDTLCGTRRAVTAASLAVCLLLLLAVVVGGVGYAYSRELLVLAVTRGWCSRLVSAEVPDADKEYDVFVSFSHKDERLVLGGLVPRLEGALGQRVCVHSRDWVVGDLIPAQIVRSVESSRRTLIVLSEAYLSSSWASMEFRAAHNLALKDGRARVLLVVLDPAVLDHPALGPELRAYVATNTYILYGDVRFWERLRKALPDRREVKLRLWGGKAPQCGSLRVRLDSGGRLVNDGQKEKGLSC